MKKIGRDKRKIRKKEKQLGKKERKKERKKINKIRDEGKNLRTGSTSPAQPARHCQEPVQ